MHVGRRAKFKLVLRARVQFLTTTAIGEVNTAAALAIKNKTPRPEGTRGFIKQGKRADRPVNLLGEHVFRDVGLGAAGRVAVHDAGLDGFVHRGSVGGAGGFGGDEIFGDHGGVELLAQRLNGGLDATVAGREAGGLAGGFDSGFGVGLGR